MWTFSILNLRPKYHEPKGFYSVQSNCQIQSFERCNVAFFAWACSWKAFALATGKRTISAEAKIYSASLSGTIFSALLHTKEEFVSQQHKIRWETLDALLQCGICATHTFSGCIIYRCMLVGFDRSFRSISWKAKNGDCGNFFVLDFMTPFFSFSLKNLYCRW